MKLIFGLLLFVLVIDVAAQPVLTATNEFRITGEVKTESIITLADLLKRPTLALPDLAITNHLGEIKGTTRKLRGILLKELLNAVEIKVENPKLLSEFYFVFIASDNYSVVYSWNEIFNTTTGDHLYVVTSKDGKELESMDDRILVVTTSDFKTGRRHIKGLREIRILRYK